MYGGLLFDGMLKPLGSEAKAEMWRSGDCTVELVMVHENSETWAARVVTSLGDPYHRIVARLMFGCTLTTPIDQVYKSPPVGSNLDHPLSKL